MEERISPAVKGLAGNAGEGGMDGKMRKTGKRESFSKGQVEG